MISNTIINNTGGPLANYNIKVANGDLDDHVQHHLLHDACVVKVFSSKVRWGLVGLKFDQVSLRVNDSKFNYENIKE